MERPDMSRRGKQKDEDESIDSDEIPDHSYSQSESEESEVFYEETPDEKRLRLARQYLEDVKQAGGGDEDVADRLENDYLEETNRRFAAISVVFDPNVVRYRAHRNRPTAVCFGKNCVFSASKDGSIVRACLDPRKKDDVGQCGCPVFCLAYDKDRDILASGDERGVVSLWSGDACVLIQELQGHTAAVTGVAFRSRDKILFSCSADHRVRVWDSENGNCLATLFGHQMEAISIDCCGFTVSCGADRTVRMWNYEEEKQFVFHGGGIKASIDCVSMFNNHYCVSGTQDGKICLWDLTKKKPLATVNNAHGPGNWISAVAAMRYRKLFASGSYDGFVRFWKVTEKWGIEEVHKVELTGHVTDLRFSDDGTMLAVQLSSEQRLGRWIPAIKAKQGVYIIKVQETA